MHYLLVYILNNHIPSKSVSSTIYKLWTGRRLDLMHLSPQWSAAYDHDPYIDMAN